jgi:UDP-N-acetylglucosamine 2-epimerase (non-hydrolysing)
MENSEEYQMILICFGTRPEYIKIKPILQEFNKNKFNNYKILFTGQHQDLISLNNLDVDYRLEIKSGSNRLDSIFCSLLNNENIFEKITHVLVQGDTASASALALAAFHRNIKIIHLEAGLRTHDINNPYPEEFYRRMISSMSSINFCVSDINRAWLEQEKCPGINYVVGNTVLDNLKNILTFYENKILITLHRRENHDIMDKWFLELEKLANQYCDYEFLLPIHPNPNVLKHVHLLKKVQVIEPLPHLDLLNYMSKCKLLITDSGGLQEESSFLKKKSIVCRKTTERVEGLNTFSFLCKEPNELEELFSELLTSYKIDDICPYGNGNSSEAIYDIIKQYIY